MDHRKVLGLLLTGAFGVGSWALGSLVSGLSWLPWVALPLSVVAMLMIGALMLHDWLREHRRKSLPGLSIYAGIRFEDQQEQRRRYYFDLAAPGRNGASFYRSASGRFVFSIEDVNGEAYSLEMRPGSFGIPVAQSIGLSLEAGTDGTRTFMRVAINGLIIAQRELPFAVDFPPYEGTIMGANRNNELHGAMRLYRVVLIDRTLDHTESKNTVGWIREALPAED